MVGPASHMEGFVMPKVKMLRDISGAVGGNYNVKVGDVINVSDVVADDLCDRDDPYKLAERVATPRKAATRTKKKRETATRGPDETADEA